MTISNEGAVPSPDGPEMARLRAQLDEIADAAGYDRSILAAPCNALAHNIKMALENGARAWDELSKRGSPDGGDLPALAAAWESQAESYESSGDLKRPAVLRRVARELREALAARGVGALPAPREESEAIERAIRLMEAEWEVYVVRGDKGVSFTAADRYAIRDRVRASVGASRSGPEPREDTVTRVELIDHRTGAEPFGRVFSAWNCRVEVQRQDGGRTLKVFVDGEAPPPPDTLSDAERAEKLAGVRLARSGGGSAPEPKS